jgi:acid phosphatase (class A)
MMGIATASCLALLASGAALAQTTPNVPSLQAPDLHLDLLPGYLKTSDLPDSLRLLPPPPAEETASLARDEEARRATVPLRGTARWDLAKRDADLSFPQPAANFSCAMGISISAETTPQLYTLMRRMFLDVGLSTYGMKNKFHRTRPFVAHSEGTCTPGDEDVLRTDGSYPSGHSAVGWGWALALAEINPERANELLARGLAFGRSRVICNAHWQSDIEAGRTMAAATFARLHADSGFVADMKAAREEILKGRQANMPASGCDAETSALAAQ